MASSSSGPRMKVVSLGSHTDDAENTQRSEYQSSRLVLRLANISVLLPPPVCSSFLFVCASHLLVLVTTPV